MVYIRIFKKMAGILSGFEKFFTKQRVTIFVFFGILVVFLMWYSGNKYNVMDSMDTGVASQPSAQAPAVPTVPVATPDVAVVAPAVKPNPASGSGYALQPIANPEELLPKDQNSKWASLNPVNQGNVMTPDLLQAGYHIGLDTIGQSLKNPSYDLRSDPYIPKKEVGPWNQSTYEPDLMRVPLEVGQGPQ
jgi:hypothetical protein